MPNVRSDMHALWPRAKIAPPRLRAVATRPRLLQSLNAATGAGNVVLVVALGGTGKTTLLVDWARQSPDPVAWYALDAADRDPRRLVTGLCAAIERVVPNVGQAATAALASGGSAIAVADLLLGALEDRSLAIVVDDFHHLDEQEEVLALWDHILRFKPESLCIIISSRTLPLGFGVLNVCRHIVGGDDLAFDAEEARLLVTAHEFDDSEGARWAAANGGWAFGILLYARCGSTGLRVLRQRKEAIVEHLVPDILAALPPGQRPFVCDSVAIGPATPKDADTILGRTDSAARYAEVEAGGVLLTRMTHGEQDGEDGVVYRYHDVIGAYLATRLATDQTERWRDVRRAAAAYWAAYDDLPRALDLLMIDQDWDELARMLEHERHKLWKDGLWTTALTCVERLPEEHRTAPVLGLCGHIHAERGEHIEALRMAEAIKFVSQEGDKHWLEGTLVAALALRSVGRYDEAIAQVNAALMFAPRADLYQVVRLQETRALASIASGRHEEGQSDLQAALEYYEMTGRREAMLTTLVNLSHHAVDTAVVSEAKRYMADAFAVLEEQPHPIHAGHLHHNTALLALLTGDVATARSEVDHAIASARQHGVAMLECDALGTLAKVCADAGDIDGAEEYGRKGVELAAGLHYVPAQCEAQRARIGAAILRRDETDARRLIAQARALEGTSRDRALLDLLNGTLDFRVGSYQIAAATLQVTAERLEELGHPHQAACALLLAAACLHAKGGGHTSGDVLNRMAALILPLGCEGYLRPTARLVSRLLGERHLLRRMRKETRALLNRLAGQVLILIGPAIAVATTDVTLHLSPFGAGRIIHNGVPIKMGMLPAKARELLFFAGQSCEGLSRDAILTALWEGDTTCATALWDASRHVRRLLGDASWHLRGGMYRLEITTCHDGVAFDRECTLALDTGQAWLERLRAAEGAMHLYGAGGYLDGCESSWVVAAREWVTRRAVDVALALGRSYEEMGRGSDAISLYQRALSYDSLDDAALCVLLQALVAAGRVGEATRTYRNYREKLYEEGGMEPARSLQGLAAGLGCV